MMHFILFTTLTLLWKCSSFSPVLSLECNAKQYPWPNDKPTLCCDKCPPGQYMIKREANTCDIQCEPCTGKRYTNNYNVDMNCKVCDNCNKENMEFSLSCSSSHNAVCKCKAGYICNQGCTSCKAVPSTTTPSPSTTVLRHEPTLTTPPTTTLTTPPTTIRGKPIFQCRLKTRDPVPDSVWFLVIISLLCVGIIVVLATKVKLFLNWFIYNKGYCMSRKPLAVPVCMEEEDVPKPVQEMCGKCDQLIDV